MEGFLHLLGFFKLWDSMHLNHLCAQDWTKWPLKMSSNIVTPENCYDCCYTKNMHLWKYFFSSQFFVCPFVYSDMACKVFRNCWFCWYQSRSLIARNRNQVWITSYQEESSGRFLEISQIQLCGLRTRMTQRAGNEEAESTVYVWPLLTLRSPPFFLACSLSGQPT